MNDITENLVSISRLFADDTSLARTTSNIDDLEGILNHDLRVISQWSKQWLVTFNPVKTEVLYYGNDQPLNLKFDNTMLTSSESHIHLGVTLSNKCKWTINNILSSATKLLRILRKIKCTIRGRALNQIYISFLRPWLEYASSVRDTCNQLEKSKLERIQLEAAKIVQEQLNL